jgi:5'-3' exonuclease
MSLSLEDVERMCVRPTLPLLIDGDALAYKCALSTAGDYSDVGRYDSIVTFLKRLSGAVKATSFFTPDGGSKRGRFRAAFTKPYQGNRADRPRPEGVAIARRAIFKGHTESTIVVAGDCEADDLIADEARKLAGACAIWSPDKDMRCLLGSHLCMPGSELPTHVTTFAHYANGGRLYGEKALWVQLLAGDPADNIPGLPYMTVGSKRVRVGEKRAARLLEFCYDNPTCAAAVIAAYQSFGTGWEKLLAEQFFLVYLTESVPNVVSKALEYFGSDVHAALLELLNGTD